MDDVIRALGPLGASVYGATLGVMKACLRGGCYRKRRSLVGRAVGEGTPGLGIRGPKSGEQRTEDKEHGCQEAEK